MKLSQLLKNLQKIDNRYNEDFYLTITAEDTGFEIKSIDHVVDEELNLYAVNISLKEYKQLLHKKTRKNNLKKDGLK